MAETREKFKKSGLKGVLKGRNNESSETADFQGF
jgi:hypothetical protein